MHFTTGELIEIGSEGDARIGRLRVRGAFTRVDLTLLPAARVGDIILAQAGVALSVIHADRPAGDGHD